MFMLTLFIIFMFVSLWSGFKLICLDMDEELAGYLWSSLLKYDFKKILKDPKTRPFVIWLLSTIVSLSISLFIGCRFGIIDCHSIFKLRIVG